MQQRHCPCDVMTPKQPRSSHLDAGLGVLIGFARSFTEVSMSGRRSHVRFAVVRPPEGVFRVMRDVIVQHSGEREVIAISREPGLLGETVAIDFPEESTGRLRARVIESQPVVVSGAVRHRLRLEAIGIASPESDSIHFFDGGPARQ